MNCERCIWWVHISDAPPGVMECCWIPRENEEIRPCEVKDNEGVINGVEFALDNGIEVTQADMEEYRSCIKRRQEYE